MVLSRFMFGTVEAFFTGMNGTGTRATSRVSGEATPVAHGTREYREKHGHHPTLAGALGEVVLEKPSSFRAWFFFRVGGGSD